MEGETGEEGTAMSGPQIRQDSIKDQLLISSEKVLALTVVSKKFYQVGVKKAISCAAWSVSLFCCRDGVQSLTFPLLPGGVHSDPKGYNSLDSVALFRDANAMGIVLEGNLLNAAMIARRSSRKSSYPT